jgi:membrane-associated protease RseP (regulator of RpoE activity)
MVWLFVFLLGLTLYFIVQRSVVRITHTPWWQLWLALMIPAFVIVGWEIAHQSIASIPPWLLTGSFIVSVVLYIFLITRNPRAQTEEKETTSKSGLSAITSVEEALKAGSGAVTPLTQEEQAQLHNCFPWSTYYLKNIDLRPQAVICRGQLRSEPELAYQTIAQNIKAVFGDRFLVLFQTDAAKQTYFVLVNNPYAKPPLRSTFRPGLALVLLLLTLVTTAWAGSALGDPTLTLAAISEKPQMLLSGLPYAISLVAILGIRDLSYYFTARFYKIQITLPYLIPLPQPFPVGTIGGYLLKRSPIPNRKALFDMGVSGALAGLIVTIPILLWGLMHSELAALPAKPGILTIEALNPRFSIAFALLCRVVFGQNLTATQGIDLHPVAVAGLIGIIFATIRMVPFGQFDGGRIVHAMYGQRIGLIVSQVCRILVLLLSFAVQPVLLYLGIFLMVIPAADEPALNDVTELDGYRDGLGLLALGLMLFLILPVPAGLASILFTTNPTP